MGSQLCEGGFERSSALPRAPVFVTIGGCLRSAPVS